ncbi:MAG: mannose-1-phosphate guanylyltransferase [Treponema sp.]|nr:mannose-1-phosphate guanylyltransferase [Treponema sp.]
MSNQEILGDSSFSDVIILAGGFGERLWPASSPQFPKQFLSIQNGISFLQTSILRALAVNPIGKIIIITREDIQTVVAQHCESLKNTLSPEQQKKMQQDLYILAEPCARHTCAPLVLACKILNLFDKTEHTMLVLTSDHIIEPTEKFIADCYKAAAIAKKGNFVCFAIPPTEPATGYGYIKQGENIHNDGSVFKIAQFKEKPDAQTAQQYLASGQYSWNSGMFAFTDTFFLHEVLEYESGIFESFKNFDAATLPDCEIINGTKCISHWQPMNESYKTVKAIAVDNAIAERTKKAAAVKSTFTWDDVGSWDAFDKHYAGSNDNTASIKSHDNFVYSDIPVALCGVENLIVVIKDGKALVMKKGSSGSMRDVVKEMKNRGC